MEDVRRLVAVRADELAHVLDDAQHRDVHLVEHLLGAHHVGQRHVLRRGHQHRARGPDLLRDGQRDVAGARRQVQDQVVELAPVHVAHELHAARRGAWARARSAPGPARPGSRSTSPSGPCASSGLERLAVRADRPLVGCRSSAGSRGRRSPRRAGPPWRRSLASATARFTATVLLPTPPLPAPTRMMFFTPGSSRVALRRRRAPGRPTRCRSPVTPGTALSAASASAWIFPFSGQAGVVSSIFS